MARMSPKDKLRLRWTEWKEPPKVSRCGHGVLFASEERPENESLLAFIDGFHWLHGTSKVIKIYLRKPDEKYGGDIMADVRRQIEKWLEIGELKPGQLGGTLFVWIHS